MKRTTSTWAALLTALALSFGVVACGDDDDDSGSESGGGSAATTESGKLIRRDAANASKPAITIGSKNFTEQFILGNIYAEALEAAGFKVRRQLNLGSEQIALRAVKGGQVDAYPEYTGTALTSFCDVQPDQVPKEPLVAYRDTRDCLAEDGLTALAPTPFTDSNGFAMTEAKAEELGIRRLSDLQGKSEDLVLSGSPECRQRTDCKLGLERTYDLSFKSYRAVDLDLRHQVLTRGQADVSVVFTTDGQIQAEDLRLLEDDKKFLPPYNVTLLVRDQTVESAGTGMQQVIEQVQEGLTTPVMQELNSRVDIDKQKPEAVATAYLREAGYVE